MKLLLEDIVGVTMHRFGQDGHSNLYASEKLIEAVRFLVVMSLMRVWDTVAFIVGDSRNMEILTM